MPRALKTTDAIILAAGFGSRLAAEEGHKILAEIGNVPLLDWHLQGFAALGVARVTIVTGYESEALQAQLADWSTPGHMRIETVVNDDFERANGISVLRGVARSEQPFWLVMSDHIFEPALYPALREAAEDFETSDATEGVLVVDRKLDTIFDMPDANKVRLGSDGGLEAIGKELDDFGLVDAGMFWCGEGFVEALRAERELRGDCSTSDAVRRLAAKGQMRFWDLGQCLWQDVDTPEARAHAEALVQGW